MFGTTNIVFLMTHPGIDVEVVLVENHVVLRRTLKSSTNATSNADVPPLCTFRASFLGRCLAKLEDLRVVHVGHQLLRFFTECVDRFSLTQIFQEVIFFGWLSNLRNNSLTVFLRLPGIRLSTLRRT